MSPLITMPVLQSPQNCKFSNSLQDSLLGQVRDLEILEILLMSLARLTKSVANTCNTLNFATTGLPNFAFMGCGTQIEVRERA